MFGDACRDTPKYLEVQFRCKDGKGNVPRPSRPPLPTDPPVTTQMTSSTSSSTVATTTTTIQTSSTTKSTTKSSTTSTTEATTKSNRVPTICPQAQRRQLLWPRSAEGEHVKLACPNNPQASATWSCGRFGWINSPDLSKCVSQDINQLQKKLQEAKESMSVEIVESVANDLVTASSKPMAETYGGDVEGITSVMSDIVNQVHTTIHNVSKPRAKELANNVNQAVVTSTNNMLQKEKTESWLDLPQSEQAAAATRVISSVENSALQVAKLQEAPTVQIKVDVNIVVEVNVIDTRGEVKDVCFPRPDQLKNELGWQDNSNSITLSSKTIHEMGEDGLAKIIFTTYKNIEQYLGGLQQRPQPYDGDQYSEFRGAQEETFYPEEYVVNENNIDIDTQQDEMNKMKNAVGEDMTVNTQIISASINGIDDHHKLLPDPVYYTLEHKSKNNVYGSTCAFWEYSEKTLDGHWSKFGCEVHDTNLTHTVCKCNHLTNFAVLMDVTGVAMTREHAFALTFITYVGCLISIVCLIMAWITFQFIKNLQCDRNTIHKNLVVCLLIAEVIFLAGIIQYDKEILCRVVAVFLHYFFLAAFAWMCLEGIQLYVMLVEVFEAERSRKLWYYLSAYGIPAIIVGVTVAVDYTAYGTPYYCWLRIDGGFIWAFVGPVLAVIVVNCVMLSIAIYQMCKHARATAGWKMKQKTKLQNVRMWVKGAVVLVILLGLTWSFGLMYVNQQSLWMAYIFTALNSLQGLFIYIFHCAANEKVQKEYKKWVRKSTCLPECIRVKYGGATSYSSTPNQSMSSGNAFQRLISNRFRKRSSTTSLTTKSTPVTSPGGKWIYRNGRSDTPSNSRDSAVPIMSDSGLSPRESAIYSEVTEDPGGYLEPVSLCGGDSGIDRGSIGYDDYCSYMEGSVADSNYFDYMCTPTSKLQQKKQAPPPGLLPINVEKYKIQRNANPGVEESYNSLSKKPLAPIAQETDDDFESEIGTFSEETLKRIAEKEKLLEDYEDRGLLPRSDSEQSVSCLKEDQSLSSSDSLSSDSGNIDTTSLNDLNKAGCQTGSQKDICISDPNINMSSNSSSPIVTKEMPLKASLQSIDGATTLDKNTNIPNSGDRLVSVYHGNTQQQNRLNSSAC